MVVRFPEPIISTDSISITWLRAGPHPRARLAPLARPPAGRCLAATAPEARSSRGGGAPRERAGVGPRPESNNASPYRELVVRSRDWLRLLKNTYAPLRC